MTKPYPALHQQAFHFSELHLHTCSVLCFHFPSFLQMPAKSLDNPVLTPRVLSFPHFSQDALRSQDTLSESHSEPDFLDLISEDTTLSPSFKHQPKCETFLPFLILRSNKMVPELTKKKKKIRKMLEITLCFLMTPIKNKTPWKLLSTLNWKSRVEPIQYGFSYHVSKWRIKKVSISSQIAVFHVSDA